MDPGPTRLTIDASSTATADVLDTPTAPGWQAIGQLAAIAAIRTALTLSLPREIAIERNERSSEDAGRKSNMSPATQR